MLAYDNLNIIFVNYLYHYCNDLNLYDVILKEWVDPFIQIIHIFHTFLLLFYLQLTSYALLSLNNYYLKFLANSFEILCEAYLFDLDLIDTFHLMLLNAYLTYHTLFLNFLQLLQVVCLLILKL